MLFTKYEYGDVPPTGYTVISPSVQVKGFVSAEVAVNKGGSMISTSPVKVQPSSVDTFTVYIPGFKFENV